MGREYLNEGKSDDVPVVKNVKVLVLCRLCSSKTKSGSG